jgi:TolB-like protein
MKNELPTDQLAAAPAGDKGLKIAAFSVINLSGAAAPIDGINQLLINSLKANGLNLIDSDVVDSVITRHRIRYLGGIDRLTSMVLRKEAGADAVLITALELYSDIPPPKIALTSRLVSTANQPRILWMSGVGLAGHDSPGLLDLYLIEDPRTLMEMTVHQLAGSFSKYFSGELDRTDSPRARKKFRPKVAFRSPIIDPDLKYTLAVIPFFNLSERKHAGELMALHFIRQLRKFENFFVIEPGVVRNSLLDMRVIMSDGISLANTDLVFQKLNADLILSGRVLDYQDYQGADGTPKVDFAAQIIERKSRKVVWTVKSYGEGDNGVFFLDWGKVNTAYAMASQMVQLAVEDLFE